MADQRTTCPRDEGTTLIEILIVMMVIGIIIAAIGASVTVVLRNAPPTEVRADDARSVQGLVTWLPQDVDAAPPNGFNRAHTFWPCSGTAPANSHNVLAVQWTEDTGSLVTTFASTFRYQNSGSGWRLVRYVCDNTGGAMSTGVEQNLTSELPEWDSANPPASVTMCKSTVTVGATCPAADIIPASITAPTSVLSLKLEMKRLDGVVASIDAAPKNPDQDLADDPNASPNLSPEVSPSIYTLQMYAGDTTTIDLATTHNAADPDGDPVSVAIDSSYPVPSGITAVASDPLLVEVTADPSLSPGVLSPHIVTIVSDNNAGWVDAFIRVEIIPEPNLSPTATSSSYHLQIEQGKTVVLPLATVHGITDGNGDPLTGTIITHPASFVTPPKLNSPGPLDLEVKSPGGAPLGMTLIPITIVVSDGRGGTLGLLITVEVIAPTPNNAPTASQLNIDVSMYSGDSLNLSLGSSHGVSDPDGDPLSITDVDEPTGLTSTLGAGLDVTITADAGLIDGLISPPVEFEISDVHGEDIHVTVTVTIIPTPPPPSDCVLQTVSASPSTVARQGGGSSPHLLKDDVTVTVTYTGTCDGLTLTYDSGDTSGLGFGAGRVFPPGSPSSVVIVSKGNGGTEKWTPGAHTLTATTTSAVAPNSISTTLNVT